MHLLHSADTCASLTECCQHWDGNAYDFCTFSAVQQLCFVSLDTKIGQVWHRHDHATQLLAVRRVIAAVKVLLWTYFMQCRLHKSEQIGSKS